MKIEPGSFSANVQTPKLTDTHRVKSSPKHEIINTHGLLIVRSIHALRATNAKQPMYVFQMTNLTFGSGQYNANIMHTSYR
jgi:hypothetical protein